MFRFAAIAGLAVLSVACQAPEQSTPPSHTPSQLTWLNGAVVSEVLDCAREQSVPLIAAHRAGPRPGYAENAISTMLSAAEYGTVLFEIDVIETADGELVLLHDRTLDRTTTGTGPVAEITLEDFKALSLVDETGTVLDEAPPTLAEALAAIDGVGIAELDLKGVAPEKIVEAIRAADAMDRVLTITYRTEQALLLHELAPEMMLSVGISSQDDLDDLLAAGMDMTRVVAWLGLGRGNRELDQVLAEAGVETSYGDFRGEDEPGFDYLSFAQAGGEVLSIDHIVPAAEQLNARTGVETLLANCPAAFIDQDG